MGCVLWCGNTWPVSHGAGFSRRGVARVLRSPEGKRGDTRRLQRVLEPRCLVSSGGARLARQLARAALVWVNALVHAIASHLDATTETTSAQRAPAILTISDALVLRLLRGASERASAVRPARPPSAGDRGRRIEIELPRAASFARLSAEVERQYLRSLYAATNGDLPGWRTSCWGDKGTARQVHLRLNQLGLRLRELRGT